MTHEPITQPIDIPISPRRTLALLMAVVTFLASMHALFVIVLPLIFGADRSFVGLRRFFDLGLEANLPTFWSALLLLAAAAVLGAIAAHARRYGRPFHMHWLVLAAGFAFMSFDEAAQFHEGVVGTAWALVFGRGDGVMHYVWYLPFAPVMVILLFTYIRFLRHLPSAYMRLFIAAGAIFVGGAIGMEMVESWLAWSGRMEAIAYSQLVEETLELAGSSLFVYALLRYAGDVGLHVVVGTVGLRSGQKPAAQPIPRP